MKGSDRRERSFDTAESETLGMCGNSMRENREAPQTPTIDGVGRSKKAKGRNVDVHVCGESDGLVVPTKRTNKADAEEWAAESAEERRSTKGNAPQTILRRTQNRGSHRVCGAYGKRQEGIASVSQRAAGRQMNPKILEGKTCPTDSESFQ
jgi:hypothetical protein